MEAQHNYADRMAIEQQQAAGTTQMQPTPPAHAPPAELKGKSYKGKGFTGEGKGDGKGVGKHRSAYPELSGFMERCAALCNAYIEKDEFRLQCLVEDFSMLNAMQGAMGRERRQRGLAD